MLFLISFLIRKDKYMYVFSTLFALELGESLFQCLTQSKFVSEKLKVKQPYFLLLREKYEKKQKQEC